MPPTRVDELPFFPSPPSAPLPSHAARDGFVTRVLPPEKAPRNRWRFIVMLVLAGLAVNLLLPQLASFRDSLDVLRQMHVWLVLLAVAAQALSRVAQGLTMTFIVATARQRLGVWRASLVTLAGWSVGLLAGGLVGFAGATYRWLRDLGVRAETAVLAGWLPPLLNAGVVGAAALIGSAELLAWGKLSTAESVALASSLGVLLLAAVALFWAGRFPHPAVRTVASVQLRVARWRGRPAPRRPGSSVQRLLRALRAIGRRGGWRLPLFGAVLAVALDMLTLYFCFAAARYPVGFGVLLAGYGLPVLIGKVAVIPGGVGLVEASMLGIFAALGVPAPTAVTVMLAYRVISFWIPNLAGMPIIPVLEAQPARPRAA